MKKTLAYTFIGVFLGVVTVLAPFSLLVSEMDTGEMNTGEMNTLAEPFDSPIEYLQRLSSKTEQIQGITPATYPSDFLFVAFMLTLSLVTALGVMRHFMRKTIF